MVTTTNIYQTGLKFLEIASKCHEDVNQKFDGKPYSIHLSAVLEAALQYSQYFPDDVNNYLDVIAFAACFHDTIEDARLTYNDVLKIATKELGDKDKAAMTTEIVYALTNEKGRSRAERANEKYYEGIRTTPFASFVKFCDRYANMKYSFANKTSMAKKYAQELPHFIESLIDPRELDYKFGVPIELITAVKNLISETK